MKKYEHTAEFEHDLKKLTKKFSSLKDDLGLAKKAAIELYHDKKIDNQSIFALQGFANTLGIEIFKIKKFACRSLNGRGVKSGIRIIYAYFSNTETVVFLEIYYKGNKENEDQKRIKKHLDTMCHKI